jgi:hypothetical protein
VFMECFITQHRNNLRLMSNEMRTKKKWYKRRSSSFGWIGDNSPLKGLDVKDSDKGARSRASTERKQNPHLRLHNHKKCCFVFLIIIWNKNDRLCGLVVRVLGYSSRGPGSIPGTTIKKK